ncbi:carboxylesterase 1-like [Quillaja saponaria]|uniref:Carboxylesterase 1-like n=1 Tax=Quillaja saponaria TaxID=32244 RepID=A0AAD7VH48_QUISA|nr:carboxylesterase 1-like [Quillaja saponaria]
MADQTASTISTVDPYQYLHVVPNPDGTMTRLLVPPIAPPTSDPNHHTQVLSKDVSINQSNNTWVRIFLPREALDNSSSTSKKNKLPLIVFFHGGGFILFSAGSSNFHDFCVNMTIETQIIIASIEYRLAPEHRLPAAYDDAMEALHWIKTSGDDWLTNYADYSNCFLMGSSAGANIAYHAGLRASAQVDRFDPIKIRGLILQQPFFGGTRRTNSELRLRNDPFLPPCVTDLLWDLSLPIGVDRDHEYCNLTVESESFELLDRIRLLGWRVLVTGCDGDPLIDRQMELVKLLEKKGVQVVGHFSEGGYHGVVVREPEKGTQFYGLLKNFILSSLPA